MMRIMPKRTREELAHHIEKLEAQSVALMEWLEAVCASDRWGYSGGLSVGIWSAGIQTTRPFS